jgi:maltose alpha-D-glucosyltransferase / alpha-amylase
MRAELRRIIGYWMKMGVDGFRVDMASSLIKNDFDFTETFGLWKEVRKWFSQQYPQGVLVAEWSNPKLAIKAGFMIDFLMHFNVPGYPSLFFNKGGVFHRDTCFFDLAGNGTPFEFIQNYTAELKDISGKGYVSVPTANHDINRLNSGSRNSVDQLKAAMIFLLSLKGIPFIYYGDEIGMKFLPNLPNKEGSVLWQDANRAGSRTPMQWTGDDKAGFSTADHAHFYLPVDPDPLKPNVADQQHNPGSLLELTKLMLYLRKTWPALGNEGNIVFLNDQATKYPLCFLRENGKQKLLVVVNPSANLSHMSVNLNTNSQVEPLLVEGVRLQIEGSKLTILVSKTGYGIYSIKEEK